MKCKRLLCDYVYDEEQVDSAYELDPNTQWNEISGGWICLECGATKNHFEAV